MLEPARYKTRSNLQAANIQINSLSQSQRSSHIALSNIFYKIIHAMKSDTIMEPFCQVYLFLACILSVATAIPQKTATFITTAAPAVITHGPELWCSDGQTAVYTTDCTLGTPVSYCFSQEPPIECAQGFFPSVWHPDHCMEQSTCFSLSEPWITTKCSNGAIPYSTTTLYEGTLAGGASTVIKGEFLFLFGLHLRFSNQSGLPRAHS